MIRNYISVLLLVFFALTANNVFSQETENNIENTAIDSIQTKLPFFDRIINYFEEAKEDKSQSKFDISFIGGPSYSVDTKLGLGVVASGLYRLDKENLNLPPSNLSMYTSFSTSGFFVVGIENNTIFPNDDWRISTDLAFSYMPTKFYGIGYDAGEANQFANYDEYNIKLKIDGLRKVVDNIYVGATLSARNVKGSSFNNLEFVPEGNLSNTIVGIGYILSYDSRDFIPNPYKGLYIKFEQNFYTKTLGSSTNIVTLDFTTRAYKKVWHNGILAFDFNANINNGNVPWSLLSYIGGSRQMRGYYLGQYRDKKQLNSQIELRQKIYNRHGIAVWGGAGNVFPSFKELDLSQTLPAYGIGYRWEFKNRVNIRLDYGMGKGQSGVYFNINESF